MDLDKDMKQQLAGLLAEPDLACKLDTALLTELLQKYPYYQPLHLLLAKANRENAAESNLLAKASLYTNGQLLHHFLFDEIHQTATFNIAGQAAEIISETPLAEDQEFSDDLPEVNEEEEPEDQENTAQQDNYRELEIGEEIKHVVAENDPETTEIEEPAADLEQVADADDQEVFEEITEVDLSQYRPFRNAEHHAAPPEIEGQETVFRKPSLDDDFVFESIASSDFFAFEGSFSNEKEHAHDTAAAENETNAAADEPEAQPVENSQVSNYNDEKLPYTFLWWLAKTRKEHQSIFQPYAIAKKAEAQELQQQYVEHIFHVQSHLAGSDILTNEESRDHPVTKDFEIIDNFIRKDPQITPPNAEQIDNENKAKKSAEDQNDLVSETLANIYIEQMLYDKAIDTYQKLSLKFPEKSRYFADLIQSIEKKI